MRSPRAVGTQRHILLADHALAIVAPLLEELGAALLLDVVVRGGGLGFGRHVSRSAGYGTVFHLIARPDEFKHRMRKTVNLARNPLMTPCAPSEVRFRAARLPARPGGAAQRGEERRSIPCYRGADRDARLVERAKQEGTRRPLYVARADRIEAARRGVREEVRHQGGALARALGQGRAARRSPKRRAGATPWTWSRPTARRWRCSRAKLLAQVLFTLHRRPPARRRFRRIAPGSPTA